MDKFFFGGEMDENETLLMDTYTSGGGSSISGNAYFTDYETPFGNGSGQNIMNQSVQQRLNNGTLKEPDPTMVFNSSHLVSIITYSCLFVLSAAGNLTVLAVILKRKRRRSALSAIDFMLLHLSIADLMVTFLMMPLEIGWAATVSWRGGDLLCRIMAFFRIFGLYLSSFVLVCLAIDRYLAVAYPMQVLGAVRRGKVMMATAWALAVLCSLPQVYIFHVLSHPDFPWYTQCVTFNSLPEDFELVYQIFCMLMMYALPFTTILFFYAGIVVQLQRRTKGQTSETDGLRRSGLGNLGKAREKTLKMTVAIVVAFFICWTPYYVMCMWYMIDKTSAAVVDLRIQKFLFLFACTNSTVNPIVYGIFHIKSTFSTSENRQSYFYSRESLYRSSTIRVSNNGASRNSNGKQQNMPTPRSLLMSANNGKKYSECQRTTKRLVSWDSTNGRFC